MPDLLLYAKASVYSAGASAVVALAFGIRPIRAWRHSAGNPGEQRGGIAALLSLAMGFLIGYATLHFRWDWPPGTAMERFLQIVLPAVFVTELLGACVRSRRLLMVVRAVLGVSVGRILLHDSVYLSSAENDGVPSSILTIVVPAAAILLIVWLAMLRLSDRRAPASAAFAIIMSLQAGGMAIMLAGYLKGGAAAIPAVSSLTAMILVTHFSGHKKALAALVSVSVVSLFSLLFIGRYFGALTTGKATVLMLAPLLCWMTERAAPHRWSPFRIGMIRLLLVSVVLLTVVLAAYQEFNTRMKPLLSQSHRSSLQSSVHCSRHTIPGSPRCQPPYKPA